MVEATRTGDETAVAKVRAEVKGLMDSLSGTGVAGGLTRGAGTAAAPPDVADTAAGAATGTNRSAPGFGPVVKRF
ncbi:hypothetical protein ACFU9X_28300 [Streptomyces atratus]|uniref:hypothetical protein n=1 Tax=Streptomyces atratus TaxID=1893 RepID=UPI0036768831